MCTVPDRRYRCTKRKRWRRNITVSTNTTSTCNVRPKTTTTTWNIYYALNTLWIPNSGSNEWKEGKSKVWPWERNWMFWLSSKHLHVKACSVSKWSTRRVGAKSTINVLKFYYWIYLSVRAKSKLDTHVPTRYEYVDFFLSLSFSANGLSRTWFSAGWHFIPGVGNLNECNGGTLFYLNECQCVCVLAGVLTCVRPVEKRVCILPAVVH